MPTGWQDQRPIKTFLVSTLQIFHFYKVTLQSCTSLIVFKTDIHINYGVLQAMDESGKLISVSDKKTAGVACRVLEELFRKLNH